MKEFKGFTLIEVLVVALLAGIVGLGTINSIAQSNKILNQTTLHAMANANTFLLLNEIAKDVKEGVALEVADPEHANLQMTIHYANGTTVKWGYAWSGSILVPERTSRTGTKRKFNAIGFEDQAGTWKYFLPFFHVNRNSTNLSLPAGSTKYHKLDVFVQQYDQAGNYWDHLARSTIYCKQVASQYGF